MDNKYTEFIENVRPNRLTICEDLLEPYIPFPI